MESWRETGGGDRSNDCLKVARSCPCVDRRAPVNGVADCGKAVYRQWATDRWQFVATGQFTFIATEKASNVVLTSISQGNAPPLGRSLPGLRRTKLLLNDSNTYDGLVIT